MLPIGLAFQGVVVILGLASADSDAETAPRGDPTVAPRIWQWPSTPSDNELDVLALHAAPILWFSDAEPLLWRRVTKETAMTSAPRALQQPQLALETELSVPVEDVPKMPAALPCGGES